MIDNLRAHRFNSRSFSINSLMILILNRLVRKFHGLVHLSNRIKPLLLPNEIRIDMDHVNLLFIFRGKADGKRHSH